MLLNIICNNNNNNNTLMNGQTKACNCSVADTSSFHIVINVKKLSF